MDFKSIVFEVTVEVADGSIALPLTVKIIWLVPLAVEVAMASAAICAVPPTTIV